MLARVSTSGPGTFYCFMFENDSLKDKNLSFKTVNLRSPAVEGATSSESPFSNRYVGFGTTIRSRPLGFGLKSQRNSNTKQAEENYENQSLCFVCFFKQF